MDGVHDKPGGVIGLSHFGQLVDINWLNGVDSLLSSPKIWQRNCQIPICFLLFFQNLISLINTVFCHNGTFFSLLLGFIVFDFEFLQ